MSPDQVEIIELAAWGFDPNPHRPAVDATPVPSRVQLKPAILPLLRPSIEPFLDATMSRPDLQSEFAAFRWSVEVVDLRSLLAFQRRLVLDPARSTPPVPRANDWSALLALAFGPPRSIQATWLDPVTLHSHNPDLELRPHPAGGIELYGGSPFLEVARIGQRAVLRDGYHRAFHLLAAGVTAVPAIVLDFDSLTEVYPESPWFFVAAALLSAVPPRVADFQDARLTLRYTRPRHGKTLHLSVQQAVQLQQTKELQPT